MASTSKSAQKDAAGQSLEPQPQPQPSSSASSSTLARQKGGRKPNQDAPTLEPWMRQTVALKLKPVEGRVPDMSHDVFCKKMLVEQGFSTADTLGIASYFTGIFYITFATISTCRRYWEALKAASPESPFSRFVGNCPIQREERRVTVSMRNPHTPGKDISTFLRRFCTVVKEPSKILNSLGFWTCKWVVVVRLNKDPSSPDGLQHLPPTFSLGNSTGLLFYPDMPQTCRRCGGKGHEGKDCKEDACRFCRVTGHTTKDCPKSKTCNLCGQAAHNYKDCPQRERTWASVAAKAPKPAPAPEPAAQKAKEGKKAKASTTTPVPPRPTPAPPRPSPAPSRPTPAPSRPTPAPAPPSPSRPTPASPAPARPTPAPASPAPARPTPAPASPTPAPTEETAFPFPPSLSSGPLSPAPCPTQPPFSPGPAAPNLPPAAGAYSLEDFPLLPPPGTKQRKRKGRDTASTESIKRKIIEARESSDEEEEEMEQAHSEQVQAQSIEELLQDPDVQEILDTPTIPVYDVFLEERYEHQQELTGAREEDPPDRSGN